MSPLSHPDSHMETIGYSVQNRPIEGVFLGPSTFPSLDTLFLGVFHGDEGISGALLQRFIEQLQRPSSAQHLDPQWEIPFNTKPVLVVPVLNPDGLALRTRVNANGVDLNRNYPTVDWLEENVGTAYYSGNAAGSEPETSLVMQLMEQYQPRKIVTVHSPYRVINFDGPAKLLAEAMSAKSTYPVVESIGYPTPGSFGTYAGKERSIPVITLELPPALDDVFDPELPPAASLDQVWEDNQYALVKAILFNP